MFLVDNFKTVLLVGLICTAGFSPSYAAATCKKDGADSPCEGETNTECKIDKMGVPGGCAAISDCPDGKAGGDIACNAEGCCCTAKDASCNDPTAQAIKDAICAATGPKPESLCPAGTTGGGTPDGKKDDGGEFKCIAKKEDKAKSDSTATTVAPAGRADEGTGEKMSKCAAKKFCKYMNETFSCVDSCTDEEMKTCCTAEVDKECTITIAGGSAVFGSLQLVTFLATALYFVPIKSAS